MSRAYSAYEAKAKLGELLRKVRAGQTVVISHRGEPVAELRPLPPAEHGLESRLARLRAEGVLSAQPAGRRALGTAVRRPGALKRFLAERD